MSGAESSECREPHQLFEQIKARPATDHEQFNVARIEKTLDALFFAWAPSFLTAAALLQF